jgi:Phosphoinositide phospholipase C, Ca2+-dependent
MRAFFVAVLISLFPALVMAQAPGATAAASSPPQPVALEPAVNDGQIRINQIQAVGTHNSYKVVIPPVELALIRSFSPAAADGLDYSHQPLEAQLNMGMRQLELDVLYDPRGGRYARPALARMTRGKPGAVPYDASGMNRPGYKVLHAQDVDFRSHCLTFILCLQQIDAWSKAHPDHVPILILINAKDGPSSVPLGTKALDYDAPAFVALDNEIRSVLGPQRLITPDQVRGTAPSLREGVLAGGWPMLAQSRGKIMFALDEPPAKVAIYMRGQTSLEGLVMFVNSISQDAPHAAYFTINHPVRQFDRILATVQRGFLVRTRADSEIAEAKANDPARLNAALASGAHYISTDYPSPRADFGPYQARLPGNVAARTNPVSAPK